MSRRCATEAIERDPEKGTAHYLAGVAAIRSGKLEKALAHGYAASSRHGTYALRGRSALRTRPSPTSRRDSSPSVTSCWFADAVRLRHNGVSPC